MGCRGWGEGRGTYPFLFLRLTFGTRRRLILLAGFFAGGLGALGGFAEELGSQHRLMDGIGGNMGFVGIIVALLARMNPVAAIPVAPHEHYADRFRAVGFRHVRCRDVNFHGDAGLCY